MQTCTHKILDSAVSPWCQYISNCDAMRALPLSSEYYRLVLALQGTRAAHTVIITDICGQDTEVYLNHMCLEENAHSCTCFNGVSAACGLP